MALELLLDSKLNNYDNFDLIVSTFERFLSQSSKSSSFLMSKSTCAKYFCSILQNHRKFERLNDSKIVLKMMLLYRVEVCGGSSGSMEPLDF